jgi:hypothetical protein
VPDRCCSRCGAQVLPPTLLHHEYRCPQHGEVAGLSPAIPFAPAETDRLAARSDLPIWFPRPLPVPWLVTGLRCAEDPRGRVAAVAVGFTGRGLSDGPSDVVIVAEQPGCGLGAMFAGLAEPDPGADCFAGPAASRIRTGHRSTGLWSAEAPSDRVAFVGEADGNWLWIIGWPDSAWSLVDDDLRLGDARSDVAYRQYPAGALNPRLAAPGANRSGPGLRPPRGKP